MNATLTWWASSGQLERGKLNTISSNVTTDHVDCSWQAPPPVPPARSEHAGRGGGDERPSRWQVLAEQAVVMGSALLTAIAVVQILERR